MKSKVELPPFRGVATPFETTNTQRIAVELPPFRGVATPVDNDYFSGGVTPISWSNNTH